MKLGVPTGNSVLNTHVAVAAARTLLAVFLLFSSGVIIFQLPVRTRVNIKFKQ